MKQPATPVVYSYPGLQVWGVDACYVQPEWARIWILALAPTSNSERRYALVDNATTLQEEAIRRGLGEAFGHTPHSPEELRFFQQIDFLFITHVHLDHGAATALWSRLCPHAKIYCHPRAQRHLADPSKLERAARTVYGDATFERLYGKSLEPVSPSRLHSVEHGEVLSWQGTPIHFFHLLGHAKHHIGIHLPQQGVFFSGDSFGLNYPALQKQSGDDSPMEPPLIFPSTSPSDYDGEEALKTYQVLASLNLNHVFPTHFDAIENVDDAHIQLSTHIQASQKIVKDLLTLHPTAEARDSLTKATLKKLREHYRNWLSLQRPQAPGAEKQRWLSFMELDLQLNAQGLVLAAEGLYEKSRPDFLKPGVFPPSSPPDEIDLSIQEAVQSATQDPFSKTSRHRSWPGFVVDASAKLPPRGLYPKNLALSVPGIGDRLRTTAFAEIQAEAAFRWAARMCEENRPGWPRRPEVIEHWRFLADQEAWHRRWLLQRAGELGVSLSERPVQEALWHSFLDCTSAFQFAHFMANAERRGQMAGERFGPLLMTTDPISAQLFFRIAKDEEKHIQSAEALFPSLPQGEVP